MIQRLEFIHYQPKREIQPIAPAARNWGTIPSWRKPISPIESSPFFSQILWVSNHENQKKPTCGEPPKKESPRHGYGSIPIHTIFSGMNIHLPAILGFTRGTRVLTHSSHIASSWLFLAKPLHFATGAWCHVMEPADVAGHNWEGASSRAGGRPWHPLWKVMVVDPQKHQDL